MPYCTLLKLLLELILGHFEEIIITHYFTKGSELNKYLRGWAEKFKMSIFSVIMHSLLAMMNILRRERERGEFNERNENDFIVCVNSMF